MFANYSLQYLGFVALCLCSVQAEDQKILSIGSDSMSHLMQTVAEAFKSKHSNLKFEIYDPGSSKGIATLIDDQADICPSAREITESELEKYARLRNGVKPIEIRIARSFIAIYVNKENPVNEISMDQIAQVFAAEPNAPALNKRGEKLKQFGEKLKSWGDLTAALPEHWKNEKIVLVRRNAASITYALFKSKALDHRDLDPACQEMPGNGAVLNAVSNNRAAIGFGGTSFMPERVKALPIKTKKDEAAIGATRDSVAQNLYPLTHQYYLYLPRKPTGIVKEFMEFILSKEGQTLVGSQKVGFVPMTEEQAAIEMQKLK